MKVLAIGLPQMSQIPAETLAKTVGEIMSFLAKLHQLSESSNLQYQINEISKLKSNVFLEDFQAAYLKMLLKLQESKHRQEEDINLLGLESSQLLESTYCQKDTQDSLEIEEDKQIASLEKCLLWAKRAIFVLAIFFFAFIVFCLS